MARLEALIELRDKVRVGDWQERRIGGLKEAGLSDYASDVLRAYHGSLYAAEVLHEALLPLYSYIVDDADGKPSAYVAKQGFSHRTQSDCPARAWLLAILETLIAQEQTASR